MKSGNISVNTENIFPIIKKFLYSDHEIFLRELVSNATDASKKLKTLSSLGEFKGETGDLKIKVVADKEKNTLTISDRGLGMTADEIEKYINQLAFSGAEEFVNKYKDKTDTGIIGHFGLGFYSAFMVADQVEIQTLSYQEGAEPAHWVCDGSTSFTIDKGTRTERGTDIILHLNEDSKEFSETYKVRELLTKYCRFLPVEIEFEEKVINNTNPLWLRKPADLKDEDYTAFYSELYPFAEPPLFWIHLNVDYPFNLTGILYFPKVAGAIEAEKHKVQLYSNQVYVTDNVKDILPEFLMLLHGVIDSPDIPLNVSRSSLQSDNNVKKITSHISKKVADKLAELFKADLEAYKAKWESINVFVKYGMLSDDKFAEKANEFCLVETSDNKKHTLKEYIDEAGINQKDKDGKTIILYAKDREEQYSYIRSAVDKGYSVAIFDGVLDSHFTGYIERKYENTSCKRVDAAAVDKLIDKGEEVQSSMDSKEAEKLKKAVEKNINEPNYKVETEALSPSAPLITIAEDEFMRRMKDMSQFQGPGMGMFGNMPNEFKVVVNTNHPKAKKFIETKGKEQKDVIKKAFHLALLSNGLLKGEKLHEFLQQEVESL